MMIRSRWFVTPVLCLLLSACGGDGTEPASAWEHETATNEEGETVVRTLSGSVWGGQAALVEEQSIGVFEGADEYSFAQIADIWVSEDRILVVDGRLSTARIYDREGEYLATVGSQGQGPGEYERVVGGTILPDGRIALYDGAKVLLYGSDGEYLEQWGSASTSGFMFFGSNMMTVRTDGTIYVRKAVFPEDGGFMSPDVRWGMKQLGPEGLSEELLEPPSFDYAAPTVEISVGSARARVSVPFTPSVNWAMLPSGGFVAGLSADYRFRVQQPDTDPVVVEKAYEPVLVDAAEVELREKRQQIVLNGEVQRIDYGEMDIPEHKPAYDGFVPDREGRVLVIRSGPATVNPDCLGPDVTRSDLQALDCTDGVTWADVFELDGTFLGTFEVPGGVNLQFGAFVAGDEIWAPFQDEMGTVMVKRYRLVSPGDAEPT